LWSHISINTMHEVFLFPRLSLRAARAHLQRIKGRSVADLSGIETPDSADVVYPATGGARVRAEVLQDIRGRLLESARGFGFPDSRGGEPLKFDPEAAAILFQHVPICPGEASRDDVWSFMSICLLPDLTSWRFPDQNDRRFLGGVRNAFQRLWWRAAMLREDDAPDPWGLVRLPEDALVGLMERPGISSNRLVARAIASAVAKLAESLPSALREDAWRAAYKGIRQRIPLVNFDALSRGELATQLESLCQTAIAEVRSAHSHAV
jgi:uncharacterized protein DUF6339